MLHIGSNVKSFIPLKGHKNDGNRVKYKKEVLLCFKRILQDFIKDNADKYTIDNNDMMMVLKYDSFMFTELWRVECNH